MTFFLMGRTGSRSSWTWGGGEGEGGGGAGGGGEGVRGTRTLALFHMAWSRAVALSSEQAK